MKEITFVGSSDKEFEALPEKVRNKFSLDLVALQKNTKPFSRIKHLDTVGKGVVELIKNGKPAHRVIYCAKFDDTIYVLHAFTKTTNGVDGEAIKLANKRYKDMLDLLKLK